ncbi:MAG: hypothetical protein KGI69_02105 [Patescibacteria group bacterium]|nr:hypothetical protein [Patescibacteria group bacterium]
MERRNSRPWRKALSSPLVLAGAVVLFAVLARADWNIHQKSSESAAKLSQASAGLEKLTADQAALSAEIAELSTSEGIKAELRDRYHATEPGESVAVIIDQSATSSPAGSTSVSGAAPSGPAPSGGWWSGLLRIIGL